MSITSAWFRSGTVSVTKDQSVVQGFSTAWVSHLTPIGVGDAFTSDFSMFYEVVEVLSDTQVKLDRPYEGVSATKIPYAIVRNGSSNFSVRTASAVQKSLSWYQEQLGLQEKLLTEDGDVVFTTADGTEITLWSEKKKISVFEAQDAALTQLYNDKKAQLEQLIATGHVHAMSENEMLSKMQAVEREFEASGFVHFGNHVNANGYPNINQGLFLNPTYRPQYLFMGEQASPTTESKTDFPVTHIAGVISKLLYIGTDLDLFSAQFSFPEAPEGTVVLDRDTGVPVKHATAAEAFQGELINGSLTDGMNNIYAESARGNAVIEGGRLKITDDNSDNNLATTMYCQLSTNQLVSGKEYTVKFHFEGETNTSFFVRGLTSGTTVLDTTAITAGAREVTSTFIAAADEAYGLYIYAPSLGTTYCSSLSVMLSSCEVVLDRTDMYGLEMFWRLVDPTTSTDVYPGGIVGSGAATMNGIATSDSTRPDSYFAQYVGQTSDIYKKRLDFATLTVAQQAKVLADPDNNLWVVRDDSGNLKVIQACLRPRSFAGAGNGRWFVKSPSEGHTLRWGSESNMATRVKLQADSDTPSELHRYYGKGAPLFDNQSVTDNGVFVGGTQDWSQPTDLAYGGVARFLVMGLVPRLNQGVHCPINSRGSAKANKADGWGGLWHHGLIGIPRTLAQCFHRAAGEVGLPANENNSGAISAPSGSGRPDGRFYDAIVADEFTDLRYLASGVTAEQSAEAEQQCEAGTYRGLEVQMLTNHLKITQVGSTTGSTYISNQQISGHYALADNAGLVFHNGYAYQLGRHNNSYWVAIKRFVGGVAVSGDYAADIDLSKPFIFIPSNGNRLDAALTAAPCVDIQTQEVSGAYYTKMVVGDPSDILQAEVLKNGWQGYWCSEIPDGTSKPFPFIGKALDLPANITRTHTSDGVTWLQDTLVTDSINNSVQSAANNLVWIHDYKVWAKMTKSCANKPPKGGTDSVKKVIQISDNRISRGNALLESVIGKCGTNNAGVMYGHKKITSLAINAESKLMLFSVGYRPEHAPVTLASTTGVAAKIMPYPITTDSGKASLAFAANEMAWDFSLDNGTEFTNIAEANGNQKNAGEYFHVTDGKFQGYWRCVTSTNTPLNRVEWSIFDDKLTWENGIAYFERWSGNGWGDSGEVTIVDNEGTYTNDNGSTLKAVTHELALPIGHSKTLH